MRFFRPILFLLLLVPFSPLAQTERHPSYIPIGRAAGLPSEEVYDICEDDKGYMWLATGVGLYRFDGFSFMQWQNDSQTSVAGSCVRRDCMGRIWYENFDGYLYYTDGKKLRTLRQNRPTAYMPFGITGKYLFVLQSGGIDVYNIQTLALVKTVKAALHSLEHATCSNGSYYVAADGIIYRLDSTLSISSYKIPASLPSAIHQLYPVGDSIFILPRQSGANIISVIDGTLKPARQIKINAPGGHRAIERIGDITWLCTSSGCIAMNAGGNTIAQALMPGKSVSKILRDRNGKYWVGTTNEGIYIIPDLNNIVYSPGGSKMRQVATYGKGILMGTQTGELMRLTLENGNITTLSRDKHNGEIYFLYADNDNIIYSATGHTMLTEKGALQETVADIAIKSVAAVDERYYAVAASGLCLLMPRNGKAGTPSVWDTVSGYAELAQIPGSRILVNAVRARSVAYDSISHTIFCATNTGIVTITPQGIRTVTHNGAPVYAAQLAAFGRYIYAADTKGRLLRFIHGGHAEYLEGLPMQGPVKFLKMTNGRLFYCSNRQLYEFSVTGTAQPVDIRIDADEINDIAATDSNLWLATNTGLVSIVPGRHGNDTYPPGFCINAVLVNDIEVTSERLRELTFSDNNITINYSVIEFAASVPASLSYSINNAHWQVLPGNSRTLHFRALSPGNYHIRFRVNDKNSPEQVLFNISPPFWQQVWFYVFCLTILLAIGLAYYSYRVRAAMKKVEEQKIKLQMEERLSSSMLTALRSQMNPHFFFNALNTVQAYIFTNEKSKAGDHLAKLSLLTRTILEMSEAETVSLNNEIDALKLYLDLEKTRFGEEFRYEITVTGIAEFSACEIPSMILQPFVENAVKHGLMHKEGEKMLDIRFAGNGNILHITIDDNGIGRARSQALNEIKNRKYKSYSTRATAERVKLLNALSPGRIQVDITDKATPDGLPQGTTVTIKIKIA